MLKPYIQQLKSQDPAERRKAIKGLARLRNPAAVPLLETVANSDPDPGLRELAEKAIRYIKANPAPEQASENPPPPSPAEEAAPAPRRHVSPRDRENARAYVNAAFSYYQAGDRARAVDWLGKGLTLNPNLQSDSFVAGIVQSTMNMSVSEALPILTQPDRRKAFIASLGGKKRIRAEHVPEDATWHNVLIDLGLYGIVVMASQFATWLFAINVIKEIAQRSPELYGTQNVDALFNMDIRGVFMTSLAAAVYAIIAIALQGGFIHLAATYFLGGQGTLTYLYRKLVPLQTVFTLILATVIVALGLLVDATVAVMLLSALGTVAGIAIAYLVARVVAQVYDFGMWSGCGAVILGGIIFSVILFCGMYGLLALLFSLLG